MMATHGTPTVRKRVGDGYKYVPIKSENWQLSGKTRENENSDPVKTERQATTTSYGSAKTHDTTTEKHELETTETESNKSSSLVSIESLSLPLFSMDFREDIESSSLVSIESLSLPLSSMEDTEPGEAVRYEDYPILRYIQDGVIGHNITVQGPFGTKRVVFCDFTASGRPLSFIEDYIRTFVCPFYANTHSDAGRNARQTSKFREEARDIVRQCCNATKDDVVIFTGSGATAGLHKLAWALKVNQPRVAEGTVVIIGPYEHHANILLWKEFGATVIRIKESSDGTVDLKHFTAELKFWREKKRLMLACMSAASNVTGIVTDTERIAEIAHKYGAFAAFDFAGGGPYLEIDMNPSKKTYKDAVCISPHKFVGGPGSPGVLVAKKWLFRNHIPDRVGGGTVVYVSRDIVAYSSNIEAREEGGTPAIIESIRTGLVFQLKRAVGVNIIAARDRDISRRAFAVWEQNPCMTVLGSHSVERVTIFSFVVSHLGTDKLVHFNFIATLLNDLFGIQSRGGCACAGPYGHDLLGITESMAKRFKWFTNENIGKDSSCPQYPVRIMMPGFVRVNLPYFYDDETVDYIITAVDIVSTHGWKLLPQYTFDPQSGNFMYKGHTEEALYSLRDIDYSDNNGRLHINRKPPSLNNYVTLQGMLAEGEQRLLEADTTKVRRCSASRRLYDVIPKDKRALRWFITPDEVTDFITGTRKAKHFKPVMVLRIDAKAQHVIDNFLQDKLKDKFVTENVKECYIKETMKEKEEMRDHLVKERKDNTVKENIKEHSVKENVKNRFAKENVKYHYVKEDEKVHTVKEYMKEHCVKGNAKGRFERENRKNNSTKDNLNEKFVKENVKRDSVVENVPNHFVKQRLKETVKHLYMPSNGKQHLVKENAKYDFVKEHMQTGFRARFRRLKEATRFFSKSNAISLSSGVSKTTPRDEEHIITEDDEYTTPHRHEWDETGNIGQKTGAFYRRQQNEAIGNSIRL